MQLIVKENYIITDIEIAEERLTAILQSCYKRDEMLSFINTQENTFFYLDEGYKICESNAAKLVWIDTGYEFKNEPVFISMRKYDDYLGDYFGGYFVGTPTYFFKGLMNKRIGHSYVLNEGLRLFKEKYAKRIELRACKHLQIPKPEVVEAVFAKESVATEKSEWVVKHTNVTQEIFDSLLFPSWRSINGLDRYIKIVGKRIEQLIEKDSKTSLTVNDLGDVVVNTGLIDSFGRDVLVLYRINYKYSGYVAYKIMYSKNDFIEAGFTREQAVNSLKPISFFDEENMFLRAEMTDFDISHKALVHIVDNRRERFPENLQKESSERIATLLWEALERGLKMKERDVSYAKANYSARTGEVSWLLPLHVNKNLTEEPELVIVIHKTKDFYEVKTVLPYDDTTKDKITALALFSKVW